MSLGNVRSFYERLGNDEAFHTRIQEVKSKNGCSQIVKDHGYDFTQEELEEFTAQVLESDTNDGGLQDLDEKELTAVFGGIFGQPLYGVPRLPNKRPPIYQPMYGIVRAV